ncbi:hypothetical protein PIB30_044788 [Stylosanthes scabra]|uniref:Reverse transcriptase zinc-binding domain-containing protein n=1 Tax=Stylosanthes scabra TaxID=79078 RepID=A0ABU6TI18_9FABA|nr:hypothetical protein [Stylosanthes scabra]
MERIGTASGGAVNLVRHSRKANTRDKLVRCGILCNSMADRVLCKEGTETVYHLFFTCKVFWELWCKILKDLNMCWTWPGRCLCAKTYRCNKEGQGRSSDEIIYS